MIKIHCAYDELIPIEELKKRFHPKNRNKHPQDQIERLAKILKYSGIRKAAVVSNLSDYMTAGHGRVLAAELAGCTEYPVNFQDYDDEAMEYADIQADNAIASWAELDLAQINLDLPDIGPLDIDMLGIKGFVVEPAEKFESQADEDSVPENVDTRCKPGDIWQLGRHRLMCGDSTNIQHVERLMNGEKADMVFTDPPYGINEEGDRSSRHGITEGNKLKSFQDDSIQYAVDAFNIVTAMQVPVKIFWGANYYAHHVPQTNNWLVWDKRVEDHQKDYNSDCELAWVENSKNSVRIFRHLWKGLIKGSEHGEKRIHPTQKPIALAEWCFENYGNPKTVLDLFGGSGSTLIACEKTNRKCFMMEIDPHYCDVILERWEKYTGQKAELIDETPDNAA